MRRTYAALLCFVWLLGIEVLPNAHLLSHADGHEHEHAADGTVITVSFDRDTHSHDGIAHSHSDAKPTPRAKRKAPRDVLAIERVPDLHVAAGLAHRATALSSSPPPIVDVRRIDSVQTEHEPRETGRAAFALVATRDARGPPSA